MNAQAPWWVQPILAALTQFIFAVAFGALLWHGDNQNIALMIGAIIAHAGTVITFYFGSSSSSQKKDEIISRPSTITLDPPKTTITTGEPK